MNSGDATGYDKTYAQSIMDPEGFWGEAAAAVRWDEPWRTVLEKRTPQFYRWFSGGRLNTCYNCVDHHVHEGRGEQTAIIHDSPITGGKARITYSELLDLVSRFAGVLRGLGVEKGDRVLIYMPMIPQTLVAMLATARLGAIHSVVFGGFAASELATRLEEAEPKGGIRE